MSLDRPMFHLISHRAYSLFIQQLPISALCLDVLGKGEEICEVQTAILAEIWAYKMDNGDPDGDVRITSSKID